MFAEIPDGSTTAMPGIAGDWIVGGDADIVTAKGETREE